MDEKRNEAAKASYRPPLALQPPSPPPKPLSPAFGRVTVDGKTYVQQTRANVRMSAVEVEVQVEVVVVQEEEEVPGKRANGNR